MKAELKEGYRLRTLCIVHWGNRVYCTAGYLHHISSISGN